MAHPNVEAQFKDVVNATWAALKDAGFTKRGTSFRIESGGNVQIIDFQRSSDSSASAIKFTVNLGVISGELLRKWDPEKVLSKEGVWSAHLRERIGALTPAKEDKWWTVTSFPVANIKEEVANLIATLAVPFLRQHAHDSDLIALWQTGRSPGLTEGQKIRNLALLSEAS
ncbi:MAG: DUF4304 domain-containing protein [Sphingobium phenoxybenzoativorans]